MIKYWWVVLVGALFTLSGCQWTGMTDTEQTYTIQGITAYQGQDVDSLFNTNGAPNTIQNLPDGSVVWIYDTNYRPIGNSELISYDVPNSNQTGTSCSVQVTLLNGLVTQVNSDCLTD